ncbi:MarR family transcriptional regulator, partial [Clavibacter phaseoli]
VVPELARSAEMRRGLIDVIRAAGRPAPAAETIDTPAPATATPGRAR